MIRIFKHGRIDMAIIGMLALRIGEEIMTGDGGIAVVDQDTGVEILQEGDGLSTGDFLDQAVRFAEVQPEETIVAIDPTASVIASSLDNNLKEAEGAERYIEGLGAVNEDLSQRRDETMREMSVLRGTLADDAGKVVDLDAQIEANRAEIADARVERDRAGAIAGAEIDALNDDDD